MERISNLAIMWLEKLRAYINATAYRELSEAADHLAAYEDTSLTPEEITEAIKSASKLISAMRNNKKAALWLRKYEKEANDHEEH